MPTLSMALVGAGWVGLAQTRLFIPAPIYKMVGSCDSCSNCNCRNDCKSRKNEMLSLSLVFHSVSSVSFPCVSSCLRVRFTVCPAPAPSLSSSLCPIVRFRCCCRYRVLCCARVLHVVVCPAAGRVVLCHRVLCCY